MSETPHEFIMRVRRELVSLGYWAHDHRDQIYYAEVRPIPVHLPKHHLPFTTDCSGIITMFARWAGVPVDPNGENYSGSGYTGTLLHLPHIPLKKTWRGDIAILGPGTGSHAVMLLQGGSVTDDPLVASHGHPGADDPTVARLSVHLREFNHVVTYCQIIPGNKL
jgi:hypothetical protein